MFQKSQGKKKSRIKRVLHVLLKLQFNVYYLRCHSNRHKAPQSVLQVNPETKLTHNDVKLSHKESKPLF